VTEPRGLRISIDGTPLSTPFGLLTDQSSGIEPTSASFMHRPMSYSFEVTLYESRITAPIRKRPHRVRRKIEARDGALHVDPARRRKPGSRGRALIRALQKQQRARFVHDVELAMLYGDPK